MRLSNKHRNRVSIVIGLLILITSFHFPHSASNAIYESNILTQDENSFSLSQVTKSRREAVTDYIIALYSEDGYFHYSLSAPPYEGLLGLYPNIVNIHDGHSPLMALGSSSLLNWNSSKELLLNLINRDSDSEFYGLINNSQSVGPDVAGLYTGTMLFEELDMLDTLNIELIMNWVASCQQTDGGFSSNVEFTVSKLTYTYFGISLLSAFGYTNRIDSDACISFVLNCKNADGGFGVRPGGESNSDVTPLVLMTLDALGGISEINHTAILDFEFQNWDNATGCNIGGSIVETERSLWSISLLESLNFIDIEKAIEWILSCQSHEDGSFRMYPGDDSDRLEFCRAAVHSLELLNSVNSLNVLFTIQETPVWETPDWYLDKISDLTSTINGNPSGVFIIPDIGWIIDGIIAIAPISLLLVPFGYCVYLDRREKAERRKTKERRRKKR
ncbi:MAG: prenyltransferase/squalene oxidase repeat-containing protein [Candidatus Thorarchaeota archaeon]